MTVKINTRWKTAEDLNRLRGTSAWTKMRFFWRRGWMEIPVIMGSSFVALTGICMSCYTIWYANTHDATPKYFETPRIYRPDDPQAKKIRRVSAFDKF